MKIFFYAAIHTPKDPKKKPELIIKPSAILAKDEAQARMKATRELPDQYMDCLEEVEIVIRPF